MNKSIIENTPTTALMIWQEFINCIKEETSVAEFDNWFSELKVSGYGDSFIAIEAPAIWHIDYIESNFHEKINEFFRNKNIKFQLSSKDKYEVDQINDPTKTKKNKKQKTISDTSVADVDKVNTNLLINKKQELSLTKKIFKNLININSTFNFNNFIEVEQNRLAKTFAISMLANTDNSIKMLYIFGKSGYGKTHLMHALIQDSCIKYTYDNSMFSYYFSNIDGILNDIISSITNNTFNLFKQQFENINLLVIDDIQFLSKRKKNNMEEQLCNLIDSVINNGNKVIVICDRPLYDLDISPRFKNRISNGIICSINDFDFNSYSMMANQIIKNENIELPESLISYISKRCCHGPRQVKSILNNIIFRCKKINPAKISESDVNKILEDCGLKHIKKHSANTSILKTLDIVAKKNNIDRKTLIFSQKRAISKIRKILIFSIHSLIPSATIIEDLAKMFEKCRTVISRSINFVKNEITQDQDLLNSVQYIKNLIHKIIK